jgi:hypothetical protein
MKNLYKDKITKLHQLLSKDASVKLQSFFVGQPASPALLDKFGLRGAMRNFYAELNGWQLSYVWKENTDFKQKEFGIYEGAFPWMWPNENYWHLDGCINMLPLEVMMESDWEGYLWFKTEKENYIDYKGKKMPQQEFERKLKPLDVFSKSSIAVIYPDNGDFDVLLSSDHNAAYTDFPEIDFENYVEGLMKTKGDLNRRKEIFKN